MRPGKSWFEGKKMGSFMLLDGGLGQSAVREIANIGLGHATTALATMTGKAFNMSVPDAESIALEQIPERLGGGEHVVAGIYMPIAGEVEGHIAFLLPWSSAQALWRMLLQDCPDDLSGLDALYASALMEVGNIIDSSFLCAISDMTSLRMESTPPNLCVDMGHAVLQAIVCEASRSDAAALAIRTTISDETSQVEGFFVFIPTVGGLKKVFASLGIPEAA